MSVSDCSPLGPFTWTSRSLIVTVTPLTGATGFLPVRDILYTFLGVIATPRILTRRTEYPAEYLTTQILGPRLMVSHDALGGRHDRHTKALGHLRNVLHRRIDTAARPGDALDGADHRKVVGVLQLDLEGARAVVGGAFGVATNETLALQHVEDAATQGRGRGRNH